MARLIVKVEGHYKNGKYVRPYYRVVRKTVPVKAHVRRGKHIKAHERKIDVMR
jgi:hypothetical protein